LVIINLYAQFTTLVLNFTLASPPSIIRFNLLHNKSRKKFSLSNGWRMGCSSPQEGGTTDEDYYVEPHQMFNSVMKPTAPKEKNIPPQFCKATFFIIFYQKQKIKTIRITSYPKK
jgi:hypothetical protein